MTIQEHAARVIARVYSKDGPARVFPDWSQETYKYALRLHLDADALYNTIQSLLKQR